MIASNVVANGGQILYRLGGSHAHSLQQRPAGQRLSRTFLCSLYRLVGSTTGDNLQSCTQPFLLLQAGAACTLSHLVMAQYRPVYICEYVHVSACFIVLVPRHICPVVPEMHVRLQGVCRFLTTCRVLQQVDPDKAFAVQIAHEENVVSSPVAYLQCALLYTSSSGERRIRQVALQCTTAALHRFATFIPPAQFNCPGHNCKEFLGASKSWWGVSRGFGARLMYVAENVGVEEEN